MAAVDEPVHIVEYRSRWPEWFTSERERIATASAVPVTQCEHIGSTAVPGLVSKPIIDIMLGVASYPPQNTLVESLVDLGYEFLGEADVPERLYFRLRGTQSYNVHVVQIGGTHWISNIALRNYLRTDESARNRYATTKRSAIASGATALLAYSEAKARILATLLQEALAQDADT